MIWSFRTNGNYIDFVHTDETDLHIEQTIFHLHNTSRCIDWSLPVDTTRITFTIDESKYENVSIYDIDFDGVVMNIQGDFETNITAMFSGLAGGGSSSYLTYVFALSQTGALNAPTPKVFENTLGGTVVWSRLATGFYKGLLVGAFNENKTWIPNSDPVNRFAMYPLTFNTINDYAYQLYPGDSDSIFFQLYNSSYVNVDLTTVFGDGVYLYMPEVRVYP